MKYLVLLCSLFFSCSIHPEGFIAGTPVATEGGYASIEALQEGDEVLSYDLNCKSCINPVIFSIKRNTPLLVKITLNDNEVIFAAPDQPFMLWTPPIMPWTPSTRWAVAASLKEGDQLKGTGIPIVKNIELIESEAKIYAIHVASTGNFCVSRHHIVAHTSRPNFGAALAAERGRATMENIATITVLGATAFGGAWLVKRMLTKKHSDD